MKVNYKFIPPGSVAERKEKELYLDVGNKLEYGVIDHHQLNIQKSATTLTFENPQFIPKDTEIIIVHKNVDLDCVASSYLSECYLKNKLFGLNKIRPFTFSFLPFLFNNSHSISSDFCKSSSKIL